MQFPTIFLLAIVATVVADDFDSGDIPDRCTDVCASAVSLSHDCNNNDDGSDSNYYACVCAGPNASVELPTCEACVAQHDDDGHDNDVNSVMRHCSFQQAAVTSSVSSSAGAPHTTIVVTSDVTPTSSTPSAAATTVTSIVPTATSSVSPSSASPSSASSSPGTNAAATGKPAMLGLGAVVAMGFLNLA